MKKPITQTFNDGVLAVYRVDNIAAPGNRLKDGLLLKFGSIPYEERTVGVTRFVLNMQAQSTIVKLLRIPYVNGVSMGDVVIPIDGEQYKIKQAQVIKEVEPKCLDLSLERVTTRYEFG